MTLASDSAAFVRALRSEGAKLRRARLIGPALLLPGGFVTFKGLAFAIRGEEGLGAGRYSYDYFFSSGQFLWERLLIPLLAVAICAWLVWLEDESGHWKVLLSQPLPRGAFYLSKLTIAWATALLLQSSWWLFHSLCGRVLGLHGAEAIVAAGGHATLVTVALAPLIGVQLLLSVLLRSPFAALAIGVVGNTASLILAGSAINYWHPWGLAQVAGQPAAGTWTAWAALGTAAALAWGGVFRVARQDF